MAGAPLGLKATNQAELCFLKGPGHQISWDILTPSDQPKSHRNAPAGMLQTEIVPNTLMLSPLTLS